MNPGLFTRSMGHTDLSAVLLVFFTSLSDKTNVSLINSLKPQTRKLQMNVSWRTSCQHTSLSRCHCFTLHKKPFMKLIFCFFPQENLHSLTPPSKDPWRKGESDPHQLLDSFKTSVELSCTVQVFVFAELTLCLQFLLTESRLSPPKANFSSKAKLAQLTPVSIFLLQGMHWYNLPHPVYGRHSRLHRGRDFRWECPHHTNTGHTHW